MEIFPEDIKFYEENGYLIKRVLSDDQCDEMINYVNNNDPGEDFYEKDTKKKFGFRFSLNGNTPFHKYILNNPSIRQFGESVLKDNINFSALKCYYKPDFIARDIEYHQEYYYNDLEPSRNNPMDYIQMFTALQDHTLENACLKIIPKSHTNGVLPYQDFIGPNLEHKRRVKYDSLVEMYNKYGILNCQLKKGECIFFNHLIAHGSQTNNSPFTRIATVTTLYRNGLNVNEEKKKQFWDFRKQFVIDKLQDKINKIKEV